MSYWPSVSRKSDTILVESLIEILSKSSLNEQQSSAEFATDTNLRCWAPSSGIQTFGCQTLDSKLWNQNIGMRTFESKLEHPMLWNQKGVYLGSRTNDKLNKLKAINFNVPTCDLEKTWRSSVKFGWSSRSPSGKLTVAYGNRMVSELQKLMFFCLPATSVRTSYYPAHYSIVTILIEYYSIYNSDYSHYNTRLWSEHTCPHHQMKTHNEVIRSSWSPGVYLWSFWGSYEKWVG